MLCEVSDHKTTTAKNRRRVMKKLLAVLLAASMTAALAACGGGSESTGSGSSSQGNNAGGSAAEAGTPVHDGSKIFKSVETFPYSSLDVHKEYYSWHTQFYGISETLFRIADDMSIEPWLAESIETEDNVATITLKDGVCFSNGSALTADMVKRNLERIAEVNTRFAFVNDWQIEAKDDKTIIITTTNIYPTLANDLATAEFGMIDLDATEDFDNDPICTGPFVVDSFVPDGDISVKYNENYWGGDVQLDGATFYYMADEESKLLAMQNGEIDGYVDISAASREIYEASPEEYTVTTIPTQRRAYAMLNANQLPDSVREAIILAVDTNTLCAYMNGLLAPTEGFFSPGTYYGGVQAPKADTEKAKKVLEADGYKLNASGIYEKDGKPLTVVLSCYARRSIDTMAILMQEQLKAAGIDAQIGLEEDPDGTYMSTKNFQVGFYVSITDKAGEPFTFLNMIEKGKYLDVCGFGNDETDALIEQLRFETDEAKKKEIADKIMTNFYASNDYFAVGQYNKSTVLRAGASGLGETNPQQFYGIDANTNIN